MLASASLAAKLVSLCPMMRMRTPLPKAQANLLLAELTASKVWTDMTAKITEYESGNIARMSSMKASDYVCRKRINGAHQYSVTFECRLSACIYACGSF
jgi:hypothetical protein